MLHGLAGTGALVVTLPTAVAGSAGRSLVFLISFGGGTTIAMALFGAAAGYLVGAKFAFQLRGIGFGFLPESWARPAIEAGLLVEKQVVEPKPDETFYLAWRSGEEGAALSWWLKRLRDHPPFACMIARHCHEAERAQAGRAK